MKFLLIIVSIIVVLTVDGRNSPDSYGALGYAPGETENHNSVETDTEPTSSNQDPYSENYAHHFYSNQTGHVIPQKSGKQCYANNICKHKGGSCVSNAKLCRGRLVPGCKGKICQCCVPGNRCYTNNICKRKGGSCVSNAKLCRGRLVPGCKGKNCQCCVPEPSTVPTKVPITHPTTITPTTIPTTHTTTTIVPTTKTTSTVPTTTTPVTTTIQETSISPTTTTKLPTTTATPTTTTVPTTTTSWVCGSDWVLIGTACFHVSEVRGDWSEGRDYCAGLGTTLASIRTQEEQDGLAGLVDDNAWIGLHDMQSEGEHRWEDQTALSYSNWEPGQPDNHGTFLWWGSGEDCVEMNLGYSLRWNDQDCDDQNIYICRSNAKLQG